jgi:hypothetical protein
LHLLPKVSAFSWIDPVEKNQIQVIESTSAFLPGSTVEQSDTGRWAAPAAARCKCKPKKITSNFATLLYSRRAKNRCNSLISTLNFRKNLFFGACAEVTWLTPVIVHINV